MVHSLVGPVCVDALSVHAWAPPPPALVHVDLAVVPVEPLVALAAVRVAGAEACAVAVAGIVGAVVNLGAVDALPPQRAGAGVVGQGDERAGAAVLARAVVAGVGGHGDLAEGLRVADGASAVEGWSAGGRH